MRVLAFDSSGNGCSAAVLVDDRLLAHHFEPMVRGQAERLMPMIERTLAASGLGFSALELIAVTVGPGAFTGVRIGLAAARGLGLATGLPVLGLTSFEAVAADVPAALRPHRSLVVALDSRRDELYLQAFDAVDRPLGEGALVAPEAWVAWAPGGPILLAGDGAARFEAGLRGRAVLRAPGSGIPDAAPLARLAARRWQPGTTLPPLDPLYLRAPDTTMNQPP